MRNTIGKWLILIALFAYAICMAVWADAQAAVARCSGIEVQISRAGSFLADSVTSKGVISELARFDKNLVGKPINRINTRSIEIFLSKFSNFENVECAITTSGKLRIVIVPMIPALRVFDGTDSYYINREGKRIAANAKFFAEVPIVSGKFTDRFTPRQLLGVADYIAADSVLKHLIVMIKADGPNNIMLVPRIRGHIINIGNAANLPVKFRNLLLAYREILPYRGWETYDTISVKFNGRIIATRRNKELVSHIPEFEENIDFEEDAAESSIEADRTPTDETIHTHTAPEPKWTTAGTHAAEKPQASEPPKQEKKPEKKTDKPAKPATQH